MERWIHIKSGKGYLIMYRGLMKIGMEPNAAWVRCVIYCPDNLGVPEQGPFVRDEDAFTRRFKPA